MEKIFYKKSTAAIFVAAVMIVLLLLCMLLVTLTQLSSLNARAEELARLIYQAQADEAELEKLREFMQSNDYVKEWALQHGLIDREDIVWVEKELQK